MCVCGLLALSKFGSSWHNRLLNKAAYYGLLVIKKLSKGNLVLYRLFMQLTLLIIFLFCNSFLITIPFHSDVVTLYFGLSDAVTESVCVCSVHHLIKVAFMCDFND